jgi:hypothetical protein
MAEEPAGKIPVMQVVREAYRFFAANAVKLAPGAGICAAVAAGAMVMLAGGAAALTPGGMMLVGLISSLASIAFAAAVLRLVIRNEFQAPVGLSFGQDEFRLLGVAAGLMLVFLPPVLLVLLVFSFVLIGRMQLTPEQMQSLSNDPEAMQRAMEQALGPGGMAMTTLAIILGVVVCLWIGARLFMVQAATIGERRMVAFQTWSWTRGNMGRVILALLLTLIPPMLAATLVSDLIWGAVGQTPTVVVSLVVLTVTTFIDLISQIPVIALGGILYKGLRPPNFQPK